MPNIYEHRAKLTSLLAGQSGGPDTQALFDAITREYATAYKAIQARADRLAKDIADKSASGEGFSLSEAHRDERIQSILGTAGAELVKFASRASMDTRHAQRRALDDAYSDAKRYVRIAEGTSALNAFTNINPDVATAFIGHAADGSPLVQVFGEMVPDGVAAVRSAIVQSLLLGENPTHLANRLRRELGAPLVRAQTVARTEVMRAYRESSLGIYQANSDLVKGWIWHANLSVNTCAFCIANHGSMHAIDEHMASHPSCRCAMVPLTKSWEELGYDRNPALDTRATTGKWDGETWFHQQPPEVQRSILGAGKYKEYSTGRLNLKQLIGQRDDARWGTVGFEKSLTQIKAEAGGTPLNTGPPKPKVDSVALQREAEAIRAEFAALKAERDRRATDLRARIEAAREVASNIYAGRDFVDLPMESDAWKEAKRTQVDRWEAANLEVKRLTTEWTTRAFEKDIREHARNRLTVTDTITMPEPRFAKQYRGGQIEHVKEGIDWFRRFVSPRDRPSVLNYLNVTVEGGIRAFHRGGGINVARDEPIGVVVHELGHWLEFGDAEHRDKAQAFLKRRTAGQPSTQIYKGTNEYGIKDNFMDHYTGKQYLNSDGTSRGASEITSMGLQYFYEKPLEFAELDPDFFDWLYRTMRGGE